MEDGHYFCVAGNLALPSSLVGAGGDAGSNDDNREREDQERGGGRMKKVTCEADFDYSGWGRWNAWRDARRALSSLSPLSNGLKKQRKPREEEDWKGDEREDERNCWHDCSFPSECFEEQKARAWRERMRVLRGSWGFDEICGNDG